MARGRFIALEGGEGVGKSTQVQSLAIALRVRGIEATVTREPGGSPGAEAIRNLLLEGEEARWSPGVEALLFAAARGDHVAHLVRPALAKGRWVISDRFLDSSLAYQGVAGGVGVEAVRCLHQIGSGGLLPDMTFLLELPGDEARVRALGRDGSSSDRIGGRADTYHLAVTDAFRDLAAAEPERFCRIDAGGSAEAVTDRMLEALAPFLC